MEDKIAMYSYKIRHPEAQFIAIRKIFSEKLGKPIDKRMVFGSYRLIKTQKEQGLELNAKDMMRSRLYSAKKSSLREGYTMI